MPDEHRAPIRRLVDEYDPEQHVGLADYLIDRFCIAGPPGELRAGIERLDGMVDGVHFNPVHEDPSEFMECMGAGVLPEG